jgi:hypothetical protein
MLLNPLKGEPVGLAELGQRLAGRRGTRVAGRDHPAPMRRREVTPRGILCHLGLIRYGTGGTGASPEPWMILIKGAAMEQRQHAPAGPSGTQPAG